MRSAENKREEDNLRAEEEEAGGRRREGDDRWKKLEGRRSNQGEVKCKGIVD